jgi:hypothetical protein
MPNQPSHNFPCPNCHNPVPFIRGQLAHYCVYCGARVDSHPALRGQDRPQPPHKHPYSPPQGHTLQTPAQVGRLEAPVGPVLGSDLGPARVVSQPNGVRPIKPPTPLLVKLLVPLIVIGVVAVSAFVVYNVVKPKGGKDYAASTQPFYSNLPSNSCARQGLLSNGCDACMIDWSQANGTWYTGDGSMSISLYSDGTALVSVNSSAGAFSVPETWWCANSQFCVAAENVSPICATYNSVGDTIYFNNPDYTGFTMPSIPMP